MGIRSTFCRTALPLSIAGLLWTAALAPAAAQTVHCLPNPQDPWPAIPAAAVAPCNDAKKFLHEARARRDYEPRTAQGLYKNAASAAHQAGDLELEQGILNEAAAALPQPSAAARDDREHADLWLQRALDIERRGKQSALTCFDWDAAITYYENADAALNRLGDPASVAVVQRNEQRVAELQRSLHRRYPDAVGLGYACNQRASAPPAVPGQPLTPQCQALVRNYIAAAQANDGPRALAAYAALKQAGGCGVLDRAAAAVPPGGDQRFVTRSATPLLDQTIGACDSSPDECAARVQQLQAGTSPAAVGAMYGHAIGIGLQLGTMMGGAVLSGVRVPAGPGTNMTSIGNRPVAHTYGQGGPLRPAPPSSSSTITGDTH